MAKIILISFLFLFFYLLVLLQTAGIVPNLIFITVILINFWEKPKNSLGIFSAFAGGFFSDIFSAGLIGLQVLILLGAAIFIKIILRRYVRTSIG